MMASIHFRTFCLSLKTEMSETVILSVVSYGHESWSAPWVKKINLGCLKMGCDGKYWM